jgi:hypothetical protein
MKIALLKFNLLNVLNSITVYLNVLSYLTDKILLILLYKIKLEDYTTIN